MNVIDKQCVLSIVIITRNRKDELLKSIQSCFDKTSMLTELVIVDNGSTDGTIEMLDTLEIPDNFRMNLIKAEHNLGVAGGRNAGTRSASGDFIFFLDDDAWFSQKSGKLDELCEYLQRNEDIAIAGVDIYDARHGKFQNEESKNTEKGNMPETFRYVGAAHIIRKSSINRAELYPEKLIYGAEETYAAILARAFNQKVIFYPNIKIIHYPSEKTRDSEQVICENNNINLFVIKQLLLPTPFKIISKMMFLIRIIRMKQGKVKEIAWCIRLAKQRYIENSPWKINIGLKKAIKLLREYPYTLIL